MARFRHLSPSELPLRVQYLSPSGVLTQSPTFSRPTGGIVGRRYEPAMMSAYAQALGAGSAQGSGFEGIETAGYDFNQQQIAREEAERAAELERQLRLQWHREQSQAQLAETMAKLKSAEGLAGKEQAWRSSESAYDRAFRELMQGRELEWRSKESERETADRLEAMRQQYDLMQRNQRDQQERGAGFELERLRTQYGLMSDAHRDQSVLQDKLERGRMRLQDELTVNRTFQTYEMKEDFETKSALNAALGQARGALDQMDSTGRSKIEKWIQDADFLNNEEKTGERFSPEEITRQRQQLISTIAGSDLSLHKVGPKTGDLVPMKADPRWLERWEKNGERTDVGMMNPEWAKNATPEQRNAAYSEKFAVVNGMMIAPKSVAVHPLPQAHAAASAKPMTLMDAAKADTAVFNMVSQSAPLRNDGKTPFVTDYDMANARNQYAQRLGRATEPISPETLYRSLADYTNEFGRSVIEAHFRGPNTVSAPGDVERVLSDPIHVTRIAINLGAPVPQGIKEAFFLWERMSQQQAAQQQNQPSQPANLQAPQSAVQPRGMRMPPDTGAVSRGYLGRLSSELPTGRPVPAQAPPVTQTQTPNVTVDRFSAPAAQQATPQAAPQAESALGFLKRMLGATGEAYRQGGTSGIGGGAVRTLPESGRGMRATEEAATQVQGSTPPSAQQPVATPRMSVVQRAIAAARAGDKEAQKALDERKIPWRN